MSDSTYPAYSVLAFIAVVVVLIPLPWHFQAWNSGTCLYMIWTALACLNYGVNSIVWHNNVIDRAPIWCDISSRIIVAVSVAIPAASLCINRRLYKIASMKVVSITREEKRRAVIVDLSIGLGIPILQLVMQYIVSGHRFDIYEDIGCYPFIYNTWLAYPLSVIWPVVIGLVSAVYCILSLRAFALRRAQFNEFLSTNTALTVNRYFRLMALATAELLCTTPIAVYGMYLNLSSSSIRPWISWADTHFDYSQVDQYPSVIWRSDRQNVISFELSLWAPLFCAFIFFAFFGFADEARRNYRKVHSYITKFCTSCCSKCSCLTSRRRRSDKDPTTATRFPGTQSMFTSFYLRFNRRISSDSNETKIDGTLRNTLTNEKFGFDDSLSSITPPLMSHC